MNTVGYDKEPVYTGHSRYRTNCSLGAILILCLGLISEAEASFQLESMSVVLAESEGRTTFIVKNTGSDPLLLATRVTDLDDKSYSKQVLVTPPITRIDAGQSQQVNFVLKKGTPLAHEVLLKASFEGVGQTVDNSARMPVRQSIGMILQPASVTVSPSPWKDLVIRKQGSTLVFKNSGQHVIRLSPQLLLLPGNKIANLPNYYLMAGEEQRVSVDVDINPSAVKISPLSRFGFKQDEVTISVIR